MHKVVGCANASVLHRYGVCKDVMHTGLECAQISILQGVHRSVCTKEWVCTGDLCSHSKDCTQIHEWNIHQHMFYIGMGCATVSVHTSM